LLLAALIPIKIYSNAEADKATILKENQNKSGIYMWKNLTNDKCYIGSAVNLSKRLPCYYSTAFMENYLKYSKSSIYSALLKHGYSNFSLTILEYCEPEQCLEREDYYLCSLPHEYNILEKAGYSIGRKHSDKTKIIMSEAKKGKTHTNETKKIISDVHKGKTLSPETRKKISDTLSGHKGAAQPTSQAIEVFDKDNNKTTTYESIREAARALNLPNFNIIRNYIQNNQVKPYKARYTFAYKKSK